MALALSILYRGQLSGCNYYCPYCPFAKRVDDRTTLARDAASLSRFVTWVGDRNEDQLKILFTPWGEALIHQAYRDAIVGLSHMPQVARVAIQTNLSCSVQWMSALNRLSASFWCSYHPGETSRAGFLAKCERMSELGIRYNVGSVGLIENLEEIQALRRDLHDGIYLWINAYKDKGVAYYTPETAAAFRAVDPLFDINRQDYASMGERCAAGETSVAIDGSGDIRRCHFIENVIGNIYADGGIEAALAPRACTRRLCDCHIGYANLKKLDLDRRFDGWALGRMPAPESCG